MFVLALLYSRKLYSFELTVPRSKCQILLGKKLYLLQKNDLSLTSSPGAIYFYTAMQNFKLKVVAFVMFHRTR